jgi:acyl-CoA synthetase (AMP-forming)/AMP-acid ligase II
MASTFVDMLVRRAADPSAVVFDVVDRFGTTSLGWAEVDRRARAAAVALAERGLAGRRVAVLLPPGPEFVSVLLGCVYAGAVAVPLPPLPSAGHPDLPRRLAVIDDAAPAAAVLPAGAAADLPGVPVLSDLELRAAAPEDWRRPEIGPDSLALLQYRAGGDPRGVMVSHANLLASCRQLVRLFGRGPDAGVVSWLPPYRDMGLVSGVLFPIFAGSRSTLLDPREFRADPGRWLRLVAESGARISGGPGAAFDLAGEARDEFAGVDLSTWEFAFTDGTADTMDRFVERFGANGFRREAFFPCYWLTEATSLVAGRRAPAVTSFDADSLAPGRSTRPTEAGMPVLDRGQPADELEIAIVDPLTATRCPDGTAGEIWVSGPNVAVGYLGRPETSEHTFCARLHGSTDNFLRTGDLGFLHRGGLHVAGAAYT